MPRKDYYKILGVSQDADSAAIQKAFRKLALKHHPDVNRGNAEAEAKFKEISEAYDVLSDDKKRAQYDGTAGQADFGGFGSGGRYGYNPNYGAQGGNPNEMFGGGFSDILAQMMRGQYNGSTTTGNGFGGFGRNSQPEPKIDAEAEISLEEAAQGTTRLLVADGRNVQVKVPVGVADGTKIHIAGQRGRPDLYMLVKISKHPRFTREGDDLNTTFDLPLYTAMLGGKAELTTLDSKIQVSVPAGTANGRLFRFSGRGMPKLNQPDARGDLYAIANVLLPDNLGPEEIALFEKLRALRPSS
jgi:curved DNA-binding protein